MTSIGERKPWVCLKYGGTSVATSTNWGIIADRIRALTPTNRVWLVVSAVSKVTNALLKCIEEATAEDSSENGSIPSYKWIVEAHNSLAADMKLTADDFKPVEAMLQELKRLLDGVQLTREVSPRLRARIAAYGELMSSQLGVAFLRNCGFSITRTDSRKLLTSEIIEGVSDADTYLEADVKPTRQIEKCEAVAAGFDVVISQGFIASTPSGATCLLGRGGSDTSGALFGCLIGAQRVEIWTDVNGMFTADPRFVPQARLIRHLTYREAQELAAMGAKVLHPRCLLPAAHAGIPVEVRNTMDPHAVAAITVVSSGSAYSVPESAIAGAASMPLPEGKIMHHSAPSPTHWHRDTSNSDLTALTPVKPTITTTHLLAPPGAEPKVLAVARRKGVTLLNMVTFDMWGASGFLARIFAPFSTYDISVDLIACSQYAVSVTLDHIPDGVEGETFQKLLNSLSKICSVSTLSPCAVVSIVGRSLRTALPRLGASMKVLEGTPVHMVSEASEDLNMSFVVEEAHADELVAKLHAQLLEGPEISTDPQFGPTWKELPCGKA